MLISLIERIGQIRYMAGKGVRGTKKEEKGGRGKKGGRGGY